jgi:hypothetical protein
LAHDTAVIGLCVEDRDEEVVFIGYGIDIAEV